MDILRIMFHSWYLVKYYLALCVYGHTQGNISQFIVFVVAWWPEEVSAADSSHSHPNWCTIYRRFLSACCTEHLAQLL